MSEIVNVAEIFGKNVFNETVMKERLPKSVFKKMIHKFVCVLANTRWRCRQRER